MTKKILFAISAFIVAIPGLVILANMVWFGFVGAGFLPTLIPGDMAIARLFTVVLSFAGTALFLLFGGLIHAT